MHGPRARLLPVLLVLSGACSRNELHLPVVVNQRPIVELTYAPASATIPYSYAYQLYWRGFDPDGRVERYLYCVDPPTVAGADTPWVVSRENRHLFLFRSDDPDSLGTKARPGGYHVFVLKAVDNAGLFSCPLVEAFFSYTAAPKVLFVKPKPNPLVWPVLPPVTTFTFTGVDADGQARKLPVSYKYKLFMEGGAEFDFRTLIAQPDLLRRQYAPAFAGWDSLTGDTCQVQAPSMVPGHEYVLAVVAFDEAGAYSPVFSYDGNLLRFLCEYTGKQGPRFTVWNEYFVQSYGSGGYNTDPSSYVHVEVPYGRKIGFNWTAAAQNGADLNSFRWALDIERLDDETPRSDEGTDWGHWSLAALGTTSAQVGPFAGTGPDSLEQHLLYVEAEDSNGLKSLAIIQFRVIRPSFEKTLLFVNDTRFTPDHSIRSRPDSTITPGGLWPSAAELDTFLFARGGVRWRYYLPVTTLSPPGIFNGYSFDTLGTRSLNMGVLPLSVLLGYEHVVWMCDPAVPFTQPPYYGVSPMPALRWMNRADQTKVLELYCGIGGSTWLMGGGVGYNSLVDFNLKSNDLPTMAFSAVAGELIPGRLMFDAPHWRSEIVLKTPTGAARNQALKPAWPGAPDYSSLPAVLAARTTRTDPLPPERTSSAFYSGLFAGEVLSQPNPILEDLGSDPDQPVLVPMLDTLYFATGGDAGQSMPIMTYYHGREGGPVVCSGFPLWYFQRAQAIQLADFVLQRIWGLSRQPVQR